MANSHTEARLAAAAKYQPFVKELEGHFAKNVRACREGKKLSQGDLADRMGTSRTWVNLVEQGKKAVGFKTLVRFAFALAADAHQLLSPEQPFGVPSPLDETKQGRLGLKAKKRVRKPEAKAPRKSRSGA